MKILIATKTGRILPLAYHLAEEGNQVAVWRHPDGIDRASDGVVDIVDSWRPNVPWSDLVIVESPDLIPEDSLRTMGRPYLGTSQLGKDLRDSYFHQRTAFNSAGVRIPETYEIEDEEEIEQMISSWRMPGYRLVMGDSSFDITTEEQMRWLAKAFPVQYPELFQRIVPGSRMVHEGWFNGREWLSPFFRLYFEHTSVSEGNLMGDNSVGCMAHAVGDDDLTEKSITPLQDYLAEHSYRGPVSVSFVVADTGVWVTGIRCGFNYSSIPIMIEALTEPVGDFLFEVAVGSRDFIDCGTELVGSTEVSYGHRNPTDFYGFPIDNLSRMTAQHFRFQDVVCSPEDPMLYHMAGESGVLGYATAFGPRTDIVRRRLACTVRSMRIPYVAFRNSIGGAYEKARRNLSEVNISYV